MQPIVWSMRREVGVAGRSLEVKGRWALPQRVSKSLVLEQRIDSVKGITAY